MYSKEEKKVIDYSRAAIIKRADFFNQAALRHPEVAENFNALAEASRDMAKLVYVAPGEEDPKLLQKVAENYAPNLQAVMLKGIENPELLEELKESQQVVKQALDDAEAEHPELVPVRIALQKKHNAAPK